ncbi:Sugar phosphate permease [Sphingomonas guangdongensis]|uniref:Sugar phosphate permease n=1 Tax=Sphingomonas guangdongensis TaxID=1141890 RepID=A0A285QBD8_9SPHN|nr:MFS transporter [Sphingomonas guangdongensis]SOB78828.1 Sugar phosphate permease [Sphingomonas guangdongensis]
MPDPLTSELAESALERATVTAVNRRLLPLLGLVYLVAYIDRQNVSYAKLQMAADIGLSDAAFGLGAGLFFLGYFLFEVPSNLLLVRVGVRRWFARIMVTWGLVTVLLGFTTSGTVFYLLRFLLGAAEAGLFPGVLYAVTLWYPQAYRARAIGLFMIASAAANVLGSAVAGVLLDLDGMLGLAGWQWLFVVTGAPAVLLAPVVLCVIPDRPDDAPWLSPAARAWLAAALAAEHRDAPSGRAAARVLLDPRVLLLCLTFVGFPLTAYGLSYWLPTIVQGFGVSNTANGFINALLWLLVAFALWRVPRWAARHPHRPRHIVIPVLISAAALVTSVALPGPVSQYVALCIAACAIVSAQPIFWTLPPRFLHGAGAAAGLAAINATGNLGGFVAQALIPWIAAASGSPLAPMLLLAAALIGTAIGVALVERQLPASPSHMRTA